MGRAVDFVISGVVIIIAVVVHLISVELFAPDKPLYELGTDGTGAMNGEEWASLASEFFILWLPALVIGAMFVWLTIREYRRQVQTAASGTPGGRAP